MMVNANDLPKELKVNSIYNGMHFLVPLTFEDISPGRILWPWLAIDCLVVFILKMIFMNVLILNSKNNCCNRISCSLASKSMQS